jgi:zinc transporter ZupT
MDRSIVQAGLLLMGVMAAGAALPLYRRWSERGLHLFVAISAGIFLGAIFLHLLPELSRAGTTLLPWAAALAGLVLLFVLEKAWLADVGRGGDPHGVVWFATYIGLTVHTFATGLGCAGVVADPQLLWPFVGSIAVHKAGEAFSLATVMRLAGLPNRRAISLLAVYCLAAPVGLLAGAGLALELRSSGLEAVLTGLACGTFLYVAVGDLLPEVFHGDVARWQRVGGLILGLAVAAAGVAAMS